MSEYADAMRRWEHNVPEARDKIREAVDGLLYDAQKQLEDVFGQNDGFVKGLKYQRLQLNNLRENLDTLLHPYESTKRARENKQ
jgi:hypothetical protein